MKHIYETVIQKLDWITPRTASLICAVLLGLCFVFPLWKIELYAPQYPEGLSMSIWINRITGDVTNINLLNHYIGMKKIDALAIPELIYMPKILAMIGVLALLVFVIGKRWALGLWYAVFASMGSLGLWDFYQWEYDYGHHLNPEAPIKIPGMSYQPPFIGSKQLLNISAYSWPDWGGWLLLLVAIVGVMPLLLPLLDKNQKTNTVKMRLKILFTLISVVFSACLFQGLEKIQVGIDACRTCKMTILDPKFGGEVISNHGKVMKFDSIDCLLSFVKNNQVSTSNIYVLDFFSPGTLIPVEKASFTKLETIHNPMGSHWIASMDQKKIKEWIEKTKLYRWQELHLDTPLENNYATVDH